MTDASVIFRTRFCQACTTACGATILVAHPQRSPFRKKRPNVIFRRPFDLRSGGSGFQPRRIGRSATALFQPPCETACPTTVGLSRAPSVFLEKRKSPCLTSTFLLGVTLFPPLRDGAICKPKFSVTCLFGRDKTPETSQLGSQRAVEENWIYCIRYKEILSMRLSKLTYLILTFVVIVASGLTSKAEGAILEHYVLQHGGDSAGISEGIRFSLQDDHFGEGTAKAKIAFNTRGQQGYLSLKVCRTVKQGEIVFALLVFGVEIRGYTSNGDLVYSKDLEPFSFGDSKSGKWTALFRDLPVNITRLEVTYLGNYE
jgi:hypothetical protein